MDGEIRFEDKAKNLQFQGAERISVDGLVFVVRGGCDGNVITEIWPDEEGEKGADDIRGIKQEMASLKEEVGALRNVPLAGQLVVNRNSGFRFRVIGYDGPYVVVRDATGIPGQAGYLVLPGSDVRPLVI